MGLSCRCRTSSCSASDGRLRAGRAHELDYQITQRVRETKRFVDNVLIVAKRGSASGDTPSATARPLDPSRGRSTASAAFTPDMVNTAYARATATAATRTAARGTAIVRRSPTSTRPHPHEQAERSRWRSVIYFEATRQAASHHPRRIHAGAAFALVDSRRIVVRPFLNSFFYFRTAESFPRRRGRSRHHQVLAADDRH